MSMYQRLEAKLGQNLVMSPRMQQAIKLLQYNHIEMVEHIQEAMLENPTLEVVPGSEGGARTDGEQKLIDGANKVESDLAEQQNGERQETFDWEKFLEQRAQGQASAPKSVSGGTIHDDLPPIETNLTYGESLSEHLEWQLNLMRCNPDEEAVARVVIQNLDYRGYLLLGNEEIAEECGVSLEMAEQGVELVQELDPIGCGSRDLSECLIIQAKRAFPEDPHFEPILLDHLKNLERRNYQAISKALDLELEDVYEYHRMIRELEPCPGRGYTGEDARYITPDLYVFKQGEDWIIRLNEEGVPDLKISGYYQKVMRGASKTDKQYLVDKLKGAEFLIRSINRRRKTIRRVMEAILKAQYEFFEHGVERLRPLVLQDIADEVEVHMSTVSRVTSNKYVHTPHGTFELKFFFSTGVEDMAGEAIKSKIRQLVSSENPKKPLSDQAIANALKEQGIKVARRTVAKYREALGILSSSKRKRMF